MGVMAVSRRHFLAAGGLVLTAPLGQAGAAPGDGMYGLIGRMDAVDGRRDELIAILLAGVAGMPGCLSYIVATDPAEPNAIWITEAWDSKASHDASLGLPAVKEAIARGRPLIAAFGKGTVTTPVGGHGLTAGKPA
jgi:quinol monooxygenase YgiN